jgi:hypothetical protein
MLQPPQSRVPKGFRILDELAEILAVDGVDALCSYAALVEQSRTAQYPDVLRHARPRQLEMAGDRTSRHLPLAHQVHDLETRLVAQCLKFYQYGQLFVISVNYYLRKKFLTTRWPLRASSVLSLRFAIEQYGGLMALKERFYSISYFKTERLVELTWLPGTQQMTDKDFKEVLCVFAESALQHRANLLIIDLRQFMSRPSAEVGAWRDEVIVPKYEKAGVKKLAWVWPGVPPAEMGTGAGYQQRYFGTRDDAINWCVAPS